MIVHDLKVNGNGIFYYLNQDKPLYDGMDIKPIENMFYLKYGLRQIPQSILYLFNNVIDDDNMKSLAEMINDLYFDKWDNLYQMMVTNFDNQLNDYNLTVTETISDDGSTTGEHNTLYNKSDTEQVTGYNDDIFTDDNKKITDDTTIGTTSNTNTNVRQVTKNTSGYTKDKTIVLNQQLNYLKHNLIYDIIFTDVSQIIGNLIY